MFSSLPLNYQGCDLWWNGTLSRAGEFLWAGGGERERGDVCGGIREVLKVEERGTMMMDRHGDPPYYQSSRNVEQAGRTWNALLTLWDHVCEVYGWVSALSTRDTEQGHRHTAGYQIWTSFTQDKKCSFSCVMLWWMSPLLCFWKKSTIRLRASINLLTFWYLL